MSYEVVESQTFWDSVEAMRRDDAYHATLMETWLELRTKPFRNPKLQTHEVGKDRNGRKLFSSDVGGRKSDRRLVWREPDVPDGGPRQPRGVGPGVPRRDGHCEADERCGIAHATNRKTATGRTQRVDQVRSRPAVGGWPTSP